MCTVYINGKVVHNLTPHPIRWIKEDGDTLTIPPCLSPFRIQSQDTPLTEYQGQLPIHFSGIKDSDLARAITLKGLQPPHPLPEGFLGDAICIVSLPALMGLVTAGYRQDQIPALILAPDTDKGAVRDEHGNIIGVRGFVSLQSFVQPSLTEPQPSLGWTPQAVQSTSQMPDEDRPRIFRFKVQPHELHFLTAHFPLLSPQAITVTVIEDDDHQVVSFFLDPLVSFLSHIALTSHAHTFKLPVDDSEVKVTVALNYGYVRLVIQPPVQDVLSFLKRL